MDEYVTGYINDFVGRSMKFDGFLSFISTNEMVKGLPIPLIFLFLWFRATPVQEERRRMLLATIALFVIAIVVGKVLALSLPFSPRPFHSDPTLTLVPWSRPENFDGWSSRPSDHAVFYFAVAAAFWMINWWAGVLMGVHATIVIAFARVYFSIHWFTDILLGLVVGVAVVLLLMRPICLLIERFKLLRLAERHPEALYPLMFVVLFQTATMFEPALGVMRYVRDVLT